MVALDGGTNSQINWTNDIFEMDKSFQTKSGIWDNQLWMFQPDNSKI